jgi:hypothetical protein
MPVTFNAKILLKRGYGDPSTSLDLGEPGFDLSINKLYMGTGVGNYAVPVAMQTDISLLASDISALANDISVNSYAFIKDSCLSNDFAWNGGLLEVSLGGITDVATIPYVDGSLAVRDASIEYLRTHFVPNSSIGGELYYNNNVIDVSTTLKIDYLDFTPLEGDPSIIEGRLFYEEENEALTFFTDDGVEIRLSREIYLKVFNNTGFTIPKGKAVILTGDTSTFPNIELAQADQFFLPGSTLAVTKHDVSNGVFGFVSSYGVINDIDTSAFSTGETLYLSETIPGGLVSVPETINKTVLIAKVLFSDLHGRLLVDCITRPNSNFIEWDNNLNTIKPFNNKLDASNASFDGSRANGKLFRGIEVLDSSMIMNYNGRLISYELNTQNKLYFGLDNSVFIFRDSSNNLMLVDPVSGSISLSTLAGFATYTYVDGSLAARDNSINSKVDRSGDTMTGRLKVDASLVSQQAYIGDVFIDSSAIKSVNYIQFNDNFNVDTSVKARVFWDASEYALSYTTEIPETTIQIGQESIIRGYNNNGIDISNGQPVYVSGSLNGLPTFQLASSNLNKAFKTVGIATDNIPIGSIGYVTIRGILRDINTSDFSVGDTIYLGGVPGTLVKTEPPAPMATVEMATVLVSDSSYGKILVRVNALPLMASISDVSAAGTISNKSVLWKDGSLWVAVPLTTLNNSLTLTDSSDASVFTTRTYVDGSLALRDSSIANRTTYAYVDGSLAARDASLNNLFVNKTSYLYVDGSLAARDASIQKLFVTKADLTYVDGSLAARDASIQKLFVTKADLTYVDSSLNVKSTYAYVDGSLAARDASIQKLFVTKADLTYVDGSLAARDASLNNLFVNKATYTYVDGSLALRDASIQKLFTTKADLTYVDASLNNKTSYAYVDGSLASRDASLNNLFVNKASYAYVDGSLAARDACIGSKLQGLGDPGKVAYWTANQFINHDDNLVYDASNHRLGIGPVTLDPSNPASLTIDSGLITSINAITAFGNVNNYYQINIQNTNGGNNSSADVVATANNGDENSFYVDLGINGSAYAGVLGGTFNDAYIISNAENFVLSNIVPGKDIVFSTNGDDAYVNEKMRITSDGSVFIGGSGIYKLDVTGDINTTGTFRIAGVPITSTLASKIYVDGSLSFRDTSISRLDASVIKLFNSNFIKETSIGNDFWWNGQVLDISTSYKNQVANVGSGQYHPFYQKVGTVNQFRSLDASHGLIIVENASTAYLDASINVPAFYTTNNQAFSGNLTESFLHFSFVDKIIAAKTTNSFGEIGNTGVTQLPATTDPQINQGDWYPWGTTTWDPSGGSSIITWTNWLIGFANTQTVERCTFTLDVSNLSNNSYAVYFNNSTGTPVLDYSTVLERRSYATKSFIGHLTVLDGCIGYWHESPDVYGTPSLTRDRNAFGLLQVDGINLFANNDGSTLNLSSGSFLLEGVAHRNVDYFNETFTGSQHIEFKSAIPLIDLVDVDPSTGYIDQTLGIYNSVLANKGRYYEASTNTVQVWSGAEKFIISELYALDRNFVLVRRGGVLYDTMVEAIDNVAAFSSNASPLSSVVSQIHPKVGYIIIASDCSTILDPNVFSIQEIVKPGGTTGGGGGGTGITGALNLGAGFGIFTAVSSNLIQLKGLAAGGTNSIKLSTTADTILFDASVKNYDGSINSLFSTNIIQDNSIISLESSVAYLFTQLDASGVSKSYVDGSLATRDASISSLFVIKADLTYVDASLNAKASYAYVDGSLAARDASIAKLFTVKADQTYVDGSLNNIRTTYTTRLYVDGSLSERDSSITVLFNTKVSQSYVDSSLVARDASIQKLFVIKADLTYVDASLAVRDTSLGNLSRWEVAQDASIVALRTTVNIHDLSLGFLNTYRGVQDASISFLNSYRIVQDGSISTLNTRANIFDASIGVLTTKVNIHDASLGFLNTYRGIQDASIATLNTRANIFDASIGFLNTYRGVQDASIATLNTRVNLHDASITFFNSYRLVQDASISFLNTYRGVQDTSIATLNTKVNIHDASLGFLNTYRGVQDTSIATLNTRVNLHDASITFFNSYRLVQDASLASLNTRVNLHDASIGVLTTKVNIHDASLGFLNTYRGIQDTSIATKVSKTGDTMTGGLIINASLNVTGLSYFGNDMSIGGNLFVHGTTGIAIDTSLRVAGDVSIGGSLRVRNDSSIGLNHPYACFDVSNGNKIINTSEYYGQEYHSTFHTATTTTTAVSPTFTSDTSITATYPAGNYKITASYGMNKTVTNSDLISRLQVDAATLGGVHNHELSDTATWLYTTRTWYTTFTQASHNVDLQFSNEAAGTLSMRDVYLEVIRVS